MGYYRKWQPYSRVAPRREQIEKLGTEARQSGNSLSPIAAFHGAMTKTFWGKAWCANLEIYSDYANRLPRGRSYVKNGSVLDLQIKPGEVYAKVAGSQLYQVTIRINQVPQAQWQALGKDCVGAIDSLVELLQGKLSTAVMQRLCEPKTGLFPPPKEIAMQCSCPDWATLCKHVAAVLYGVGVRLDQQPELLFALRKVDAQDLLGQAGAGLGQQTGFSGSARVLDDALLGDVFGLEMDGVPEVDVKAVGGAVGETAKVAAVGKSAKAKAKAPAKTAKVVAAGKAAVKTVVNTAGAGKTAGKRGVKSVAAVKKAVLVKPVAKLPAAKTKSAAGKTAKKAVTRKKAIAKG